MKQYPKIFKEYNIEIANMGGNVIVQEKIDGSQYKVRIDQNQKVTIGSKNVDDIKCGMIKEAIEKSNLRGNGFDLTIYGEFLSKPKHNVLHYERVPKNNFIVFDIYDHYYNCYLKQSVIKHVLNSYNLDFEVVPTYYEGSHADIKPEDYMSKKSILGKSEIEGIVIKSYEQLHDDKRFPALKGMFMMKKIVSDNFREVKQRPKNKQMDSIYDVFDEYRTTGRWNKIIQQGKEQGLLKNYMGDMPILIGLLVKDVGTEDKETIKEKLWEHAVKKMSKKLSEGLPQYYEKYLSEQSNA